MTTAKYKNQHTDETVEAVRFDGNNYMSFDLLAKKANVWCAGIPCPEGPRIIVADLQFPMWVCAGEWLVRNVDTGELDVWLNEHFVVTFIAATETAGA